MTTSRRQLLQSLALTGVAGAVFGRALTALAETGTGEKVSAEMVAQAEWISGITLTPQQRELLCGALDEQRGAFAALRAVPLDNAVPPALLFEPSPGQAPPVGPVVVEYSGPSAPKKPKAASDLAFLPLQQLAALLRAREVSSTELTKLYLARIEKYDPKLLAVVTRTPELALKQAAAADAELAAGRWRGPLHGVPFGAKDLLAVPGYPTTWGAGPYKDQVRQEKATVVARLEAAGAVLVAKTTLGELAWGDEWFGGMTRNPWKLAQGSSGSSAGSASTVAAGLVGFAIGSETWGSIVSPSTRCGCSGLRPTFGRVSRYGAMALSWSMDKLGPIARSVEDLAQILGAVCGADGLDPSARDAALRWPLGQDVRKLRLGIVRDLFEFDYTKWADPDEDLQSYRDWQALDQEALKVIERLGLPLATIKLPETLPVGALSTILTAEAATAFDDLTRSGRDNELKRQVANAWPTVFRSGQMIPAVEYLRANRVRTLLKAQVDQLFETIDVYVAPSFGGQNLLMTNLTGHPQVTVPSGFRKDGTPTSITFTGRLYGEAELLAVAKAFQEATDFHLKRPKGFA